jgi:membrane-bound inhibitor of C-type lysozyme
MNNSKPTPLIAIGIIVVLLMIAGALYFTIVPKASAPTTTATSTASTASSAQNVVSYSCDSNANIRATFEVPAQTTATGSVALVLSDGRTVTLPQTMSGSGIRYETGANTPQDIMFSSEGDNAFLTENGKTTYNNCIAGTSATSTSGAQIFTNQGKTFSFSYPSVFSISGGGVGYSTDWMVNATTSGLLLVKATLPSSFEPKTNFANATLSVGTSADPTAISECLTYAAGGNGVKKSTVTINGVTYTKFVTSDAGAGNFYQTTSYRVVHNSQCYVVEYTIHSSNIGNYSPDQGIKAFDQSKVQNALESVVQSFKFL